MDRYDQSRTRRRLSENRQKRGSRSGLSPIGAFLFGSIFVAVGMAIILVGLKIIPVEPRSVHAPYWVLTAAGTVFALGGFMVWGMGWTELVANRRRTEARQRYPHEPALADYPWDPNGFEAPRWSRAIKALGFAGFLTLFISMFNWWAFGAKGPLMIKIIVILFDLVAFACWADAIRQFGKAIKFGGSRVSCSVFPCRSTESVILRWRPATGIVRAQKGSFTLRCVTEWFEHRGSGKNRSTVMVHEEMWHGTWQLEQPRMFQLNEEIELTFKTPGGLPPTNLSAERPVFWELEVKLDLRGLDFEEVYLVPVYHHTN